MLGFDFSEPHFGPTLLYIIFFIIIVAFTFRKATSRTVTYDIVEFLFFFFLFVCFSIGDVVTGDFYNYQSMVEGYDFTIGAHNHGEPIYSYIISLCEHNYFRFRLIVFGLACIITLGVFRRFEVNLYIALFFLFATNIRLFGYSRAILAAAVFFYGLSFLCRPINQRKLSYLIGVFFVLLSYQFHHSIVILIILTPIVFIRGSRTLYMLLILLIPLFTYILKEFYNDVLINSLLDDYDDLQAKVIAYSSDLELSYSIWGIIRGVLGGFMIYYEFYLSLRSIIRNKGTVQRPYSMLFSFVFVVILAAISFYLMNSSVTIYYTRLIRYLMIPMTILIVYLRQNALIRKNEFQVLVMLGFLLQLWDCENAIKALI